MLLKACNRCGNLIPYGSAYCSVCKPIVDKIREERKREARLKANRKYNNTRDTRYIKFYHTAEWKSLSARYSQDLGYRCEECGCIATEVHHRQAIQTPEGWERRLDYTNLELLCVKCHNKRHRRFGKHDKSST